MHIDTKISVASYDTEKVGGAEISTEVGKKTFGVYLRLKIGDSNSGTLQQAVFFLCRLLERPVVFLSCRL